MDDWLIQQFTILGFSFQNWMGAVLVIIVTAALVGRLNNDKAR